MTTNLDEKDGIRLAIEGCGHGTLHAIYASVAEGCRRKGWPGVDLLIIGGDFQTVRNAYDLNCVSMPAKYRSMCDFHEYYSGQRVAPCLTIFVGGNHEASNYLFELYYGGWVAPNIYYMGAANILRFGPLRIAGLSGIWKGYSYRKPHFERLPYNENDLRSIYHVRELDVRKLLQMRAQVDIGISHDWPNGIEWHGNFKQLFRFKAHLEEDARAGHLGSVAAKQVMDWLCPNWWFSAHLHCKYAAVVNHDTEDGSDTGPLTGKGYDTRLGHESRISNGVSADGGPQNSDEIDLDLDADTDAPAGPKETNGVLSANKDKIDLDLEDDANQPASDSAGQVFIGVQDEPDVLMQEARAALPESFRPPAPPERVQHPPEIANRTTNFLALDKCMPGKHFLQLMSIPTAAALEDQRPLKLEYDREWLAITRTFAIDEPLTLGNIDATLPRSMTKTEYQDLIDKRRLWVDEKISDADLVVPENFEVTGPVYDGGNWNLPQYSQVLEYPNPQTARFCKMLEIPNPFDISEDDARRRLAVGSRIDSQSGGSHGSRERGGFKGGRGRGGGRDRGRGGGRGRFRGR